MNILDSILFQCRINPALPALCAPGTPLNLVSYGKLDGHQKEWNINGETVTLAIQ